MRRERNEIALGIDAIAIYFSASLGGGGVILVSGSAFPAAFSNYVGAFALGLMVIVCAVLVSLGLVGGLLKLIKIWPQYVRLSAVIAWSLLCCALVYVCGYSLCMMVGTMNNALVLPPAFEAIGLAMFGAPVLVGWYIARVRAVR